MSVFYIALAIAIASFGGGYHVRDLMAEADQARAVSLAIEQQKTQHAIARAEELELIKAQQITQVKYKTIIKEVPNYVPTVQQEDSDCNVSHGVVSMYNSAASERVPDTTGLDDHRNTESSTVTEADLIRYGLDVIGQYNQVKNQCNALIAWHKHVSEIKTKDE